MDGLRLFENPEFGGIRAIELNGEPWFVLKDVCCAFGENNYRRVSARLDEDEKGVSQIATPGGAQSMTVISESGLYSALFLMQPEKARGVSDDYIAKRQAQLKKFKRWVTAEVIPSIRKHGAYMTPATLDQMIASPEFGIRLLTELKEERDRRKEVEAQKVALEAKVEADRPKVAFADAVEGSYSTILVRDLAKILRQNGVEVGEKRLFERLRNSGYLIRQPGRSYNLPTQRALEAGLFEVKETPITHTTGTQTHLTPLVTGKGQRYFVNLFLRDKAVEERREA